MAAHSARRKSARTQVSSDEGYAGSKHSRQSIGSGSIPTRSPLNGYDQPQVGPYHRTDHYGPGPPDPQTATAQDQEVTNEAAAVLFQSPINTPGDALHLLLKASGESEDLPRQGAFGHTKVDEHLSHGHLALGQSPLPREPHGSSQHNRLETNAANIDPAIAGPNNGMSSPSREALSIWARLRFVRAGWFTAREAMAYIE